MPAEQDPPPRYTRYRTRPRLLSGRAPASRRAPTSRAAARARRLAAPARAAASAAARRLDASRGRARRFADWWRRMTVKRAVLALLGLDRRVDRCLSLVLFLDQLALRAHLAAVRTSPACSIRPAFR